MRHVLVILHGIMVPVEGDPGYAVGAAVILDRDTPRGSEELERLSLARLKPGLRADFVELDQDGE